MPSDSSHSRSTDVTRRDVTASLLSIAGLTALTVSNAAPQSRAAPAIFARRYRAGLALRTRLQPLHETKRDAGPMGWLAQNPEAGQSFEEYAGLIKDELGPQRDTIYMARFGEFPSGRLPLFETTAEFLRSFYGMRTAVMADLPLGSLPAAARRHHPVDGHMQYNAAAMNSVLYERGAPPDAAAIIALTNADLWPGGSWNFVFGLSSLNRRVGVWSLARLGDPTREGVVSRKFLWRTIRTAAHECGHLLGMRHCTQYECGMNGANGLSEFDAQPLEFCPECQAKIQLISGPDCRIRYHALAEFAGRFGYDAEVAYWRKAETALTT